jgi:hypothetical protein
MSSIEIIYNKLILDIHKLSYKDINIRLNNLYLLSLSLYLKNLTKDNRSLEELKQIIIEEFQLDG